MRIPLQEVTELEGISMAIESYEEMVSAIQFRSPSNSGHHSATPVKKAKRLRRPELSGRRVVPGAWVLASRALPASIGTTIMESA